MYLNRSHTKDLVRLFSAFPVEIKAHSRPGKKDAQGLQKFRGSVKQLNLGTGLILCNSETAYPVTENDWVVPWDASF